MGDYFQSGLINPDKPIRDLGESKPMEFSIATLLSYVTYDKLVAPKILEKKLGCETEPSIEELELVLDLLEKVGILGKERGKYRRQQEEDLVEAKLRCSSKGFCFAIQEDEDAEDIYIRESHLSNAWNGDRVLVKIIKEGTRRRSPEGAVKLILERANPSVLARIKATEEGYRAVPLDDRLLFELEVDTSDNNIDIDAALDHLVHVEVSRYAIAGKLPIGKIARILGTNAESAADVDIVCCKHDLKRDFSPEVLTCVEQLPIELPANISRIDLRDQYTVAYASSAELIEQALTLTNTEDGGWIVGIHITDVASYLPLDSRLDREAKKRGTSVYLGDTTIPLFPQTFNQRCNLTPEEPRNAFSILLNFNEQVELTSFTIQPTLIQANYLVIHDQVRAILGDEVSTIPAEANHIIKTLFSNIIPQLRQQRLTRGGLEIHHLPNPTPFPDEGRLGVIITEDDTPSMAELMIMANQKIAEHLESLGLPGIYTVQNLPELVEINDITKLAENLGLPVVSNTEEEISSLELQQLVQGFNNSPVVRVLNHLFKGILKPATYSSQPHRHIGLALENGYTPFVSPLRRYPDILVQRVLTELFTQGRDRRTARAKEFVDLTHSSSHGEISWNVLPPLVHQELESEIKSVISALNDRQKIAQDAENDLEGLQKAERMKSCTGQIFQGLITGVQSYGFFVEIEEFLVEGLVHVSSLKDDWYEFRPRYSCLVGRKNRVSYRLGDRVEVQIKSVDYYRQQIDLVTVSSIIFSEPDFVEEEEI